MFSELPLAQSTISEHLRVLKEAKLVSSRPQASGNGMVYCLSPGVFEDFISAVYGHRFGGDTLQFRRKVLT